MSPAFRGISNLNLDSKGRLAIPAKYRDQIIACCDGEMIITVDFDRCLMLYPMEEWLVLEKKIAALGALDKSVRALQRMLIGHATEITMDKGGRLLIPTPLREFAQMDKQIVLIGQGSRFEIWDDVLWQQTTAACLEINITKDDLIGDLGSLTF